jgi:hypothetical protein
MCGGWVGGWTDGQRVMTVRESKYSDDVSHACCMYHICIILFWLCVYCEWMEARQLKVKGKRGGR